MKPSKPLVVCVLFVGAWLAEPVLFGGAVASAQEEEPASYSFVGVKKCKVCHKKKSTGNQYGVWLETRHAKAYETLAGDKALEEAEKRGIENPQDAPECLECHVTAFPVLDDVENQKITLEEGVSCESCHGPGSGYFKKGTMKAITEGETAPEDVGLTMPVTEETCKKCHNENSPFYKEFDFETFREKIAHLRPGSAASAAAESGESAGSEEADESEESGES